jgi:RNA polymerase sigma-70 factor (ECF subfamily)
MDEDEAIRRLRRGDIAGLEALVRLYQLPALRAAYLIVRERAVAEDVVQTAFVRVYDRIAGFDATRPFGPWFLKSVVNDAIKAASRRAREVLTPAAFECQDPQPTPELAWEHAETADEVWAALGRLSPTHRAAIVQRYYLGLSEAEIAANQAVASTTIKARLHAARARLRAFLQPAAGDLETTL